MSQHIEVESNIYEQAVGPDGRIGVGRQLAPVYEFRFEWLRAGGEVTFPDVDAFITGVAKPRGRMPMWIVVDQEHPDQQLFVPINPAINPDSLSLNRDERAEAYRELAGKIEHRLGRIGLTIVRGKLPASS